MSQSITDIPGMSGEVLQLFEAAGFASTLDLLACENEEVLARLTKTNEEHEVVRRMPSEAAVVAWQSAARMLESLGAGDEKVTLTPETMRRVRESAIMHARPVPGRELMDAGIEVGAVPVADFVGEPRRSRHEEPVRERGAGRENRRRSERKLRSPEEMGRHPLSVEELAEEEVEQPVSLPEAQGATKVYNLKARAEVSPEIPLEEAGPDYADVTGEGEDEVEPRRASRREYVDEEDQLNFRGLDEFTMAKKGLERRNSGMTHKHPRRVVLSALSTAIAVLGSGLCGLAVIALGGYYMAAEKTFPGWMVALLAAAVVLGAQYVFFGTRARCRLCGQKLFVTKACLKHEKAPRSFLGSAYATAVQVLAKRSWRCMFCGTKQKLK